jgi:septum formation protein
MSLLLASSSPRRRELLARLGVPFDVVPSRFDERPPLPGEDPVAYALTLARGKAAAVAASRAGDVVLAADTVVWAGSDFFGKPLDADDAGRMLTALRGRPHCVTTAVAVRCGGREHVGAVSAEVRMRDYSNQQVREYVATGEPMDKAGAYAVQGLGRELVASVTGCYETVVGLPLCLVADLLPKCGVALHTGEPLCRHFII